MGADPSTESAGAPQFPGGAASFGALTPSSGDPLSPGHPVPGGLGCSHMSQTTLKAHATSRPHLTVPAHGPASWVPPAQPQGPALGPGRAAASTLQGTNLSTSRGTPASRQARGRWPLAWALIPGWAQASRATWLATQAPVPGGPRPIPASSRGPSPGTQPGPVHKPLSTGTRCPVAARVDSLQQPRSDSFLWTPRTTLTPALPAWGKLLPLPALPLGLGPLTGPGAPQLVLWGPPMPSCSPFLQEPGQRLGLPAVGPQSGQGQSAGHYANAAREAPSPLPAGCDP